MTFVTFRVLEGMEQGRVFTRLKLPVSLGREDENSIQLNDDHISRFHARVQELSGRVILTDLDSTNGTRVNGHSVQVRILQVGDVIVVGRCVLLLSECQNEAQPVLSDDPDPYRTAYVQKGRTIEDDSKHWEIIEPLPGEPAHPPSLFPNGPPELPTNLVKLQKIQLSDLLWHLKDRIGCVVKKAEELPEAGSVRSVKCDWETWSQLIQLMVDLSTYIDKVNETE
ncbi:FHA domain-containing protein [Schlesneria paludicola]|uniref:FHA domain-containing protein n=1 Tax=Schlesneria paludicola TaxID=360056 RepID=UPI00029B4A36|nr:FHA domain-containing protein [Schlesneria paludicola]